MNNLKLLCCITGWVETSQCVELWRQVDFLLERELFQRYVFISDDVDLVTDSHVVFVHQFNVLPFLQRTMNYKFQVWSTLIHPLLVIFLFPAHPSARFSWFDKKQHIRGSWAFVVAASFWRFRLGWARGASAFCWDLARWSTPTLRRWCQERDKATSEPKMTIQRFGHYTIVVFGSSTSIYLVPMVPRHVLKWEERMWN